MHKDNRLDGSGDAPDGHAEHQPLDQSAAKPGGLRHGTSAPLAPGKVSPRGNFLDAAAVADELLIPLAKLRSLSRKGQYPPLLEIAPRCYRVRREDHDAWVASRWTHAVAARAELAWFRVRDQLNRAGRG
jgi:hypothetical protein